MTVIYGRITEIFASYGKSGSRNSMVTSYFTPDLAMRQIPRSTERIAIVLTFTIYVKSRQLINSLYIYFYYTVYINLQYSYDNNIVFFAGYIYNIGTCTEHFDILSCDSLKTSYFLLFEICSNV